MAGLVSGNMGSTGYTAATRTLDPNEDTVAGRVNSLIQEDSPLMQTARTGATQAANKRGLVNSTMAVQAGQQAVINTATPIATQDATFSNAAKSENMQATNRAFEFTAGAGNQLTGIAAQGEQQRQTQSQGADFERQLTDQKAQIQKDLISAEGAQKAQLLAQQAGIDTQLQTLRGSQAMQLQGLQGQQQVQIQEMRQTADLAMQNLKGTQAERIAQIEGGNRELLQTNASAQAVFTQIAKNINDIMGNANLDPANKQIAIERNIDLLEGGLAVIGGTSGLNLTSLLNF